MAIDNAAIMFTSTETPLIIDATGSTAAFLARFYANGATRQNESAVQLLRAAQPDFWTHVELAARFGRTLIVEELDGVEMAALVPLLRHEFRAEGARQVCALGEKTIDVSDAFRLLLCSRNEQIRLPGYMRAAVVEVNFSTTLAGLSSQVTSLRRHASRLFASKF